MQNPANLTAEEIDEMEINNILTEILNSHYSTAWANIAKNKISQYEKLMPQFEMFGFPKNVWTARATQLKTQLQINLSNVNKGL